jgi:Na+-transporting NADH:ubiquinone oxidoreductase subunit NqrB
MDKPTIYYINRIGLILGIVLYLFVQYSRKTGLLIPELINSYLTDFICLPLLLSINTFIIRRVFKKKTFTPNYWMVINVILLFFLVFEILLPTSSSKYTQDWWDGLFYLFGGILFKLLIDLENKNL